MCRTWQFWFHSIRFYIYPFLQLISRDSLSLNWTISNMNNLNNLNNFLLTTATVQRPWCAFLQLRVTGLRSVLSETNWMKDIPSAYMISSVLLCFTTLCLYRTNLKYIINIHQKIFCICLSVIDNWHCTLWIKSFCNHKTHFNS